jgi:hypothetical protein
VKLVVSCACEWVFFLLLSVGFEGGGCINLPAGLLSIETPQMATSAI